MMSKPDLNYLRAEMSMAQSNGETKAYVTISEIQSILHRITELEVQAKFHARPKIAGFVQGKLMRSLIEGKTKSIGLRRKKTDICTTALYFIDIIDPVEAS